MKRCTRRSALAAFAGLAGLTGLGALPGPAHGQRGSAGTPVIGLQLYSVQAELARDLPGTLAAVRAAGLTSVELAGWAGHAPGVFAQALRTAGLQATALHVPLATLQAEPQQWADHALALGAGALVVPGPLMPPGRWPPTPPDDYATAFRRLMTPAQWRLTAAALNNAGARLQAAGLALGYHNHGGEFDRLQDGADERTALEHLMAWTDPACVHLELDLGWAQAAGVEPIALLQRCSGRVRWLHVKEVGSDGTQALGRNGTDWRAVLAQAARSGVQQAYLEFEPPMHPPALTLLVQSLAYLRQQGIGP